MASKKKFETSLLDRQVQVTFGVEPDKFEETRAQITRSDSPFRYVGLFGHIRVVDIDSQTSKLFLHVEMPDNRLLMVSADSVKMVGHIAEDPYSWAMSKIMTAIRRFEAHDGEASEDEGYVISEIKKVIEEEDPPSLHIKGE